MLAMTLSEYIREVGPAAFAERFGITKRAAESYMYRRRNPRPDLAEKIVERTPVKWDGVFEERRAN